MRKLLALPFGLVFVVLLAATIAAFSLRSFALDPQFYTSTLKQQGVFESFEQDPLKYIDLSAQFDQLSALPQDTQRQVIQSTLPPGWLEQELTKAIGSLFDWLKSDQARPTVTLDLRPIKDRLQGPPGEQIAREVVASIPTCAPDQSPNIVPGRLPDCLPAVFDRSFVADQVTQVLDESARQLTSQLDVGAVLARDAPNIRTIQRATQWLSSGVWLPVAALIMLGVWLIGSWVGGRSGRERLTWLGGWLMFGAFVSLAIDAYLFVAGTRAIASAAITPAGGLTQATVDAMRNLGIVVVQQFVLRSIIPAAILLLVSVVLIGAGWSAQKK